MVERAKELESKVQEDIVGFPTILRRSGPCIRLIRSKSSLLIGWLSRITMFHCFKSVPVFPSSCHNHLRFS